MKKFIYIVLVIAILAAVSYFVKKDAPVEETMPEVPAAAQVEEESQIDAEAIGNMAIETESAEVLSDGEVVDEEIEEDNPSQTADEDETIVE